MTTKIIGRPRTVFIDEETLYKYYIVDRESTVIIGKRYNCESGIIYGLLKRYGIQTRNFSDSHKFQKYEFNGDEDVLYGSLLGDACLLKRNNKSGCGSASFSKSNIGYDHVLFVGSQILPTNYENRIYEYSPKSGKTIFKFTTLTCERFVQEYEKWYEITSLGKRKVIPTDFKLTPKIILHWFMDNGCTVWKNKIKTRFSISFATQSFDECDCNRLCESFSNFGINAYLKKSHGGFGFIIGIRAASIVDFFNLIGLCPKEIPSMKYKWKLDEKLN